MNSLCTLLFVIEQGIISITLLSVLFQRGEQFMYIRGDGKGVNSLCTLLFVIEQGIISITLLSVLFQRSI